MNNSKKVILFLKGGAGSGWMAPPEGTHLPSSANITDIESAREYWREHFAGKVFPLAVHSKKPGSSAIKIRVRFDAGNDHAFSNDIGKQQKTGVRDFNVSRARAMSRILQIIEHPKTRSRNYGADLLFEHPTGGHHYTVVLTWREAARMYEFHSAHFKSAKEVYDLLHSQDARKNEGPLQKSEPSSVFAEL